jgi:Tol biopolymer transport system component
MLLNKHVILLLKLNDLNSDKLLLKQLHKTSSEMVRSLLIILILFFLGDTAFSQYFGRNKPRYRDFEFQVVESPNFRIHHYLKNQEKVERLATWSEQWYENHKMIFGEDIPDKNPIIFYNDHPDFQQTNTIMGSVGVGVGGVTEALKNRVVMPIAFSNFATHHVLAHELVHAFQFNSLRLSDTLGLNDLRNVPLWMIEGMAEYFSLGRIDPFTAMWMRDALINDNFPTIRQMRDFRFFPYRFGHAFMAFMGGFFGDDMINPYFKYTTMFGLELATQELLGADVNTISDIWRGAMDKHYAPYIGGKVERTVGTRLISRENGGRMNISPVVSPDGQYLVYLSEKDVFSLDLFLADAASGDNLSKITSFTSMGDLDFINGFESSGSFAPNNSDFVFVGVSNGRNVLVIKNTDTGKTIESFEITGVPAFINPVYSENGRSILVTGLVDGQVDLYSIELRTKRVTRLTEDMYSESFPDVSPDGSSVVFSYDRRSVEQGRKNGRFTFDIAEMDIASGRITVFPFFHGADNLNPKYDRDGNIWFVSDRDGFRNLYKYDRSRNRVIQMTELLTGISGIAPHSPMISVARNFDRIIYTHYFNNDYIIYQGKSDQFLNREVLDVNTIDLNAGTLPVVGLNKTDIVGEVFKDIDNFRELDFFDIRPGKYKPGFRLDHLGGGGGVGTGVNNNNFRNAVGMQGGIDMLFSDILGNNLIYSQLAVNGEILDFGGMVSYINRKRRLAYGFGLSHVPLRFGFQDFGQEFLVDGQGNPVPVLRSTVNLIRIFDQSASFFVHYPFSTTRRLEAGIAGTHRGFRWDEYNDYFVGNQFTGYFPVANDRRRVPTGDFLEVDQFYTIRRGFGANANIAYVGDNSFFGLTSPLAGHRYRFSVEHFIGNDQYTGYLADIRKYFWAKPFSFAFRTTNYFRFEKEVNAVYPLYIGTMGFVRGLGSIINPEVITGMGLEFRQLLGSKMMVGSFEWRIPFVGPKQLSLIGSNSIFMDLNFFFDAGVAFDDFSHLRDGFQLAVAERDENGNIIRDGAGNPVIVVETRKPFIATVAGISARINLFGALIIEPYYAWPLQNGGIANFGLNFIPGW